MNRPALFILLLFAAVVLFIAFNSFYIVRETQQALLLQFGEVKSVAREPGLYLKLPEPLQNVIYIEDRLLPLQTPELEIADAQQRRFTVDAVARWRVVDPLRFYQTVQGNLAFAAQRLDGFLQGSMRKIIGQQPFAEVLTEKRDTLMRQIEDDLASSVKQLGIELVDVRIRRADQPQDITERTFERMKSDRQRAATFLRASGQESARRIRSETDRKAVGIRADAKSQSEIIRGRGDAERSKIFAQAYGQDPQFFAFYRSMQAYDLALDGKNTTFVLSPDSDFLKFLRKQQAQ
ncbi:MAG: protease modulator HflC [Pseudomonadota bacterium]